MKLLYFIKSLFLLHKDWWILFNKTKKYGDKDCSYDYAMRIKLRFNGSYIGNTAKIYGPPCFPHGISSIFISGGAVIGKNCVIFQQTTIGSNTLIGSKSSGFPTIGDNVYIGAGTKIIGRVKIGNNCRIGANAVVTRDCPDNTTVVVGDIRYITHDKALDTRYFSKRSQGKWFYYDNGTWILDESVKNIV